MESSLPTVNQNIGVSLPGKALTNIASVPGGKYGILSGYTIMQRAIELTSPGVVVRTP
jgi:hypothetical protein